MYLYSLIYTAIFITHFGKAQVRAKSKQLFIFCLTRYTSGELYYCMQGMLRGGSDLTVCGLKKKSELGGRLGEGSGR